MKIASIRALHPCLVSVALALPLLACESSPAEPESKAQSRAAESDSASLMSQLSTPPAGTKTSGDPLGGKFTLADATAGLTGSGPLVASLKTSVGTLSCELWEKKAPQTVANFIGLARGLRPFKDQTRKWVTRPGYDGTTFHRTIKGFMIQGGDPSGTGAGEPGYVIPDEVWEGATHDRRGLLCMANRGPNTNGMQFFIMDGKAAHLDSGYTIFGQCSPDSLIQTIASRPVQGDRAVDPVKIEKVTIERRK